MHCVSRKICLLLGTHPHAYVIKIVLSTSPVAKVTLEATVRRRVGSSVREHA